MVLKGAELQKVPDYLLGQCAISYDWACCLSNHFFYIAFASSMNVEVSGIPLRSLTLKVQLDVQVDLLSLLSQSMLA